MAISISYNWDFKQLDGLFLVAQLRTGLGVVDDDAGGLVAESNAGLDLVYVLPSCTSRAESVPGEVSGFTSISMLSSTKGYTYTETKEVCLRA